MLNCQNISGFLGTNLFADQTLQRIKSFQPGLRMDPGGVDSAGVGLERQRFFGLSSLQGGPFMIVINGVK